MAGVRFRLAGARWVDHRSGVLAIDRERRVVLANRRFAEMFTLQHGFVGQPLASILRNESILSGFDQALADRADDSEEWRSLVSGLQDQLDRAVTSAFSGPFLLASALALCALIPLAFVRRRAG